MMCYKVMRCCVVVRCCVVMRCCLAMRCGCCVVMSCCVVLSCCVVGALYTRHAAKGTGMGLGPRVWGLGHGCVMVQGLGSGGHLLAYRSMCTGGSWSNAARLLTPRLPYLLLPGIPATA